MTQRDFEIYEKNRMSKNAWRVAEIVRERVDDAPVLGDFISALLAEKNDGHNFFFNKTYLKEHQNAAQQKKSDVPGSSYTKLENFSLSICTAAVVPRVQNIVRFVLIKVGQVLCQ